MTKRERLVHILAVLIGLAAGPFASIAAADTISITGDITQSTQDGTGPAVNNPSLNNIQDLQSYVVTLVFPGSITSPGTFNLTGASLSFGDPSAPASETSFGSIFGALSLTITANGGFDEFSLRGCLKTGSGCLVGNQLDANFEIPAASLTSQNVTAIGLDQPHPLDLLEDDGATDIQGSITGYSKVPEPSLAGLLGCFLAGLFAANRIQIKKEKML
jgi:hypothetical protein